MFPLDVAPGTSLETLLGEVVPALHARLVPPDAPLVPLAIAVRIEGRGDWNVSICGPTMTAAPGAAVAAAAPPDLWLHATDRAVEVFLQDVTGPRRLLPTFAPVGGVATMSDPRVLKRVAMANGRVELAVVYGRERIALIVGAGSACRRAIEPVRPDVSIETDIATFERVLRGELGPADALVEGAVTVRGNRLLAMQLALAVAPFFPAKR